MALDRVPQLRLKVPGNSCFQLHRRTRGCLASPRTPTAGLRVPDRPWGAAHDREPGERMLGTGKAQGPVRQSPPQLGRLGPSESQGGRGQRLGHRSWGRAPVRSYGVGTRMGFQRLVRVGGQGPPGCPASLSPLHPAEMTSQARQDPLQTLHNTLQSHRAGTCEGWWRRSMSPSQGSLRTRGAAQNPPTNTRSGTHRFRVSWESGALH